MPIGSDPVDVSLNHAEGRLYAANYKRPYIRVVDLDTWTPLTPLATLDAMQTVDAGRSGRIYTQRDINAAQTVHALDTSTAADVAVFGIGRGGGECSPDGRYYYLAWQEGSPQPRLFKYDVQTDNVSEVGQSEVNGFGSRLLVMSQDGERLFWQQTVYDNELNVLGRLDDAIHSASPDGRWAVSSSSVYDTEIGIVTYDLPFDTVVSGFAGDGSSLYLFDPATATLARFAPDMDADGESDWADNCPDDANSEQADFDLDGAGDVCETGVQLADADLSQRVDGYDLDLLARAFGASCGEVRYSAAVDFDQNCMVDGTDLALLAAHFGSSVGGT